MDATRSGTDPLLRYGEGHRLKIRAQARRLAEVLAAAVPPPERGAWSDRVARHRWEDVFYEAIVQECAPRLRVEPVEE